MCQMVVIRVQTQLKERKLVLALGGLFQALNMIRITLYIKMLPTYFSF